MTQSQRIVCEYCQASNPQEGANCLACGGPLTYPTNDAFIEPKVTILEEPEVSKQPQPDDLLGVVDKADEIYFTVLNTYAIAWRTVGEAISISLTGFILGFMGGATGVIFPGVFGGILVGIAVGYTRKQLLFVLISAPAGLMLGLGLGALIWALGSGPQVMVYSGTLFAVIGALLGGHRSLPYRQRNCWEKIRPLLGAIGGFVFAVLGALLGWGIYAGIQTLIST